MERKKIYDPARLLICIAVCEATGFMSSAFMGHAIPEWYAFLAKPPFTPPSCVFAPAWIALYAMMGVAAFLVWKKGLGGNRVGGALKAFVIQLLLNFLWTPAFFGLRSPEAGLVIIVALWVAVLIAMIRFFRASPAAGALMVPYLAWVSFAVILNLAITIMN